ncbi:hypothetical protein [Acidiphilium sp. C61]|uniref:hypothetical protein n=1 Tax=Acidiphilium sp. C61 TaxID=1671485 RepID=UPI00157B73D2|nr:hypothetical protein [Acidiphilium sp. C61]
MKYLGTNEVGFDRFNLGFPSVKTCQAIVYQTSFGLFGFHDALTNKVPFTRKCEAFRTFVQNLSVPHTEFAECLIGVITSTERFTLNDRAGWATQLFEVARHLAFKGAIYGVRLTKHIANNDSAYIRYDYEPKRSKISYKTWGKMDFDNVDLDKDATFHALLRPQNVLVTTVAERDNRAFDAIEPTERNRSVHRRGRTDEGNLNVVTPDEFQVFR